jgi:hypothetical protein
MKNHVWFIEWKAAGKWIPIDYENKKSDTMRIMHNYQKLNTQYKYRKYVSE